MRLFVGVLALAVAASTQAMAFGPQRDARMIRKAEVNQGCPGGYFRGAGGNCIIIRQTDRISPIRTGHRATTRLALNIPRAVAISNGRPAAS